MDFTAEIKKSFRSLLIHRLRTLLSTLGILFGVVAVVAMLSIGEGAKQETLEQIEGLGLHSIIIRQNQLSEDQQIQARENKSSGLNLVDARALRDSVPDLQSLAPFKIIEASITASMQNKSPEIAAVTREYSEMKGLKLAEGRFICDSDNLNRHPVCVLGYEAALALGQKGHVGNTLRIENSPFQIVGILKSSKWKAGKNGMLSARNTNKTIFIPLGSEKSLAGSSTSKADTLSEIMVQMKPKKNNSGSAMLINNVLRKNHGGFEDYQIIIPQELLHQAQQTQRTFNLVLGSIAAISLLVGGIGIMNIMLANVSERIREIGIRRALGATQKDIMIQFLTETLLLSLVGALAGVLIGVIFSYSIGYVAGWKTIVTLWSVLLSLGMAVFVGICSGLYPAYQAAMMNPITALRHE